MRNRPSSSRSSVISQGFRSWQEGQQRTKCKKCLNYVWNRKEGTACGRKLLHWGQLLFMYALFLSFLFATFYFSVKFCVEHLRRMKAPIIKKQKNPAVTLQPRLTNKSSQIPFIWFTKNATNTTQLKTQGLNSPDLYVQYLDNYFQKYVDAEKDNKYVDCSRNKREDKMCLFKKSDLGPCGSDDYGYGSGKPCIYLKVNKLFGWSPEYFDEGALPPLPAPLTNFIRNSTNKKYLWVHCEGENPYDIDHIESIKYYPQQGFSGEFFPYTGSKEYLSPIVAIQTHIKEGYVVDIACSLWAKNINTEKTLLQKTHFQLYIHTSNEHNSYNQPYINFWHTLI